MYPFRGLSDFKRHFMGTHLCDSEPQFALTGGATMLTVPADATVNAGMPALIDACEFLTPPLWGIGETGPYMHDGRAITLREAIGEHCGDGEGNDACVAFDALDPVAQDAVLSFLVNQFFE